MLTGNVCRDGVMRRGAPSVRFAFRLVYLHSVLQFSCENFPSLHCRRNAHCTSCGVAKKLSLVGEVSARLTLLRNGLQLRVDKYIVRET